MGGDISACGIDSSTPERRASKRLAEDLMRFQRAFDRLERQRMGLGAIAPDAPIDAMPAADRDVYDYLKCLDEAIRQLAEEFGRTAPAAASAKETTESVLRGPTSSAFAFAAGNIAGPNMSMISQIDTSAV